MLKPTPNTWSLEGSAAQHIALRKFVDHATVQGTAEARELLAIAQWLTTAKAAQSPTPETADAIVHTL